MMDEAHFHDHFDALLAQRPGGMPAYSLAALKKSVVDHIRAENDPETGEPEGCHILNFPHFESFFKWWVTENPLSRLHDTHVDCYKDLMALVYGLLVMEAKESALFKGLHPATPEVTLTLLKRLRAMHPDLYWGSIELGDYEQFAEADAPAFIIVFATDFFPNREEIPDPFADICGESCDPSKWGLSQEAAQLMRDHNQIFVKLPATKRCAL